jgi:hypothetical protein
MQPEMRSGAFLALYSFSNALLVGSCIAYVVVTRQQTHFELILVAVATISSGKLRQQLEF